MASRRAWILILGLGLAVGCSRDGAGDRGHESPELAPGISLPRLVSGERPGPDERIVVNVDPARCIRIAGTEMDLAALPGALRERADRTRPTDRSDRAGVNVVLRLDRHLPWGVAGSLLEVCARVAVRRTHFAVLSVDGKEEGALPAFLSVPTAASGARREERIAVPARVRMSPGPGTDPVALDARLDMCLDADSTLTGRVDADGSVPVGYVLRVVDRFVRAGFAEVALVWCPTSGEPIPIATRIARARRSPGAPTILLFDRPLPARSGVPPPEGRSRAPAVTPWGPSVVSVILDDRSRDEDPPPIEPIPPFEAGPPEGKR